MAANRALSSVSSRALDLGGVEIPRWIGRGKASAAAQDLLTLAARDADRAATLLADTPGYSSESIEAVRRAARMLRETPTTNESIRSASIDLERSVTTAREAHASSIAADPRLAAVYLDELATLDLEHMGPADWKLMRSLLDAAPPERGPRQLDGMPSFAEVIDRNAKLPAYARVDRSDARRYLAAWRLGDAPSEAPSTAAADLLHRDPLELTRDDWRAMLTLLDAEPAGTTLPRTRELDLVPGIRNVLERRAKAHTRPGPPDLTTSMDHAFLERYRAAWRLEGSSVEAREAALRGLLAREPEDLSRSEWATLHLLLVDGELSRGPRSLQGLIRFDEIAAKNVERASGTAGMDNTRRYFEAWRLATAPVGDRVARARELISKDPHELDPREWETLLTILDSDPGGAVLRGPRKLDGVSPVRELVRSNAMVSLATGPSGWQVNRYLSAWRHEMDPTYAPKVARALDQVATGSHDREARRLVAIEGHRLVELVDGRPPDEQSAIAIAMLDMPYVSATRGVGGTLEVLRAGLVGAAPTEPGIAALRRETLELIDRNLARLAGKTPDGAVVGYGRHPDYAEIGRVRENVTLLDALTRHADDATTAVDDMVAW